MLGAGCVCLARCRDRVLVPVSQGAATSREAEGISNQNIVVYPVSSRDSSVLTRDLWVLTSCVACICEGVYFRIFHQIAKLWGSYFK